MSEFKFDPAFPTEKKWWKRVSKIISWIVFGALALCTGYVLMSLINLM